MRLGWNGTEWVGRRGSIGEHFLRDLRGRLFMGGGGGGGGIVVRETGSQRETGSEMRDVCLKEEREGMLLTRVRW